MFENVRVCYIRSQGQNLYSQIPDIIRTKLALIIWDNQSCMIIITFQIFQLKLVNNFIV